MITEYCSDLLYLHTILYHPIFQHVSNIRGMGSTVILGDNFYIRTQGIPGGSRHSHSMAVSTKSQAQGHPDLAESAGAALDVHRPCSSGVLAVKQSTWLGRSGNGGVVFDVWLVKWGMVNTISYCNIYIYTYNIYIITPICWVRGKLFVNPQRMAIVVQGLQRDQSL